MYLEVPPFILFHVAVPKYVNMSAPQLQIAQNMWTVTVQFNENLFDAKSVRVTFASNCTESVTDDYSNPIMIALPAVGLNIGQCQYSIQLVNRNSQRIGYPIIGYFNTEGNPILINIFNNKVILTI